MLNIYYAGESVDKERFVYDRIAEKGYSLKNNAIVIVPDQYTYETERQAFRYLDTQCLLGLDVFSMSRLGYRMLSEIGTGGTTFINKYGRLMLLTSIIRESAGELEIFADKAGDSAFIELVCDLMTQMKQYEITAERLEEIRKELPESGMTALKLEDIIKISRKYEERIAGKYTDSEDRIDMYINAVSSSKLVGGASVWIFGFDSFTPKSLRFIQSLMARAEDVNIVLTFDGDERRRELFALTNSLIGRLREIAAEAGVSMGEISEIKGPKTKRAPEIAALEKNLYSLSPEPFRSAEDPAVRVVRASNIYSEAESAAAHILHLLRDRGYRYRDIAVICNDQTSRVPVIERVFEEYGLSVFLDSKRTILDSNAANFILALLETIANRYRSQDIFRTVKTGFLGIDEEAAERLEDYTIKYRIRGMMWRKPFVKGVTEYTEDAFAGIENTRAEVAAIFDELDSICKRKQTYREFVEKFYDFLSERLGFAAKLEESALAQSGNGIEVEAAVTLQIWDTLMELFDQIVEIMGDERFRLDEFREILTAGLSGVEIGVLPGSADDAMLGTMQRSRSGKIRALLVIGANEGEIPNAPADGDIFSAEEMEGLSELGREIGKLNSITSQEERIAIYRNISKPTEELWISYAESDGKGEELRRSELIDDILEILPDVAIESDVLSSENDMELIGGRVSTLRHLTMKLDRARRGGEALDPVWKAAREWYRENAPEEIGRIERGVAFENTVPPLTKDTARELLFRAKSGKLSQTASRLEKYSRCPFSYFVDYGLRPEERRVYEIASRELGDMYHHCVQKVVAKISEDRSWNEITDEQRDSLISEVLEQESGSYREGLFRSGKREEYRKGRLELALRGAVSALIGHMRTGKIAESRVEERFGLGRKLPAVKIPVRAGGAGAGRETKDPADATVYIEGQIDRLDVLENGRVKIIDYKSSKHELKPREIVSGYTLQLMVYLEAAQEGKKEPAGAFYFHVRDPRFDPAEIETVYDPGKEPELASKELAEKIAEELRKQFVMRGLIVDDPETVLEIAGPDPKESMVVESLGMNKSGNYNGAALLSEEDLKDLQQAVRDKLSELCDSMLSGRIDIRPMSWSGDGSACTYCDAKGICGFDIAFDGCHYNVI